MKIKSERIPIKESNIEEKNNWIYNEGNTTSLSDNQKKTYEIIRVNDDEAESFVGIDVDINNGNVSQKILENSPIKSKIDGSLSYTNIQDTNLSGLSAEEAWGEIGKISGNAATNALGLSNGQLNNIVGVFKNDPITEFDKNMVKLNELKKENFKDLHPFDWKPGQTIPKDLMKSSLASVTKDSIYAYGNNKAKNIFKKVEDYVSPDPINYARNSIKRTKGIYSTIDGDQSDFSMMDDNYLNSYTMASGTSSVTSIWQKNKKSFSPFNKSQDEIKFINALKSKNTFNKTLGYIYIRPNIEYSNDSNFNKKMKDGTGIFQIPFEFNPEISEGDYQANYVSETLLNKIGQFQIYTGTSLSQLNISLKYMALTPDNIGMELNDSMGKQFSTDGWQYYWTNNRIENIEYKLRSLVFPDMISTDYLVKPPLIEIHIGNETGLGAEDIGDLYKYPININPGNLSEDEKYLATTRSIVGGDLNRYKKYIVTSVQIENLNDDSLIWPSLYGRYWNNSKSGSPINHLKTGKDLGDEENFGFSGYTRRTGFKANLRCIEVTENFLDLVPDFKSYYNAWTYKKGLSDKIYKYSQNILGTEDINKSADLLAETALTAIKGKDISEASLKNYFSKSYTKAKLYNGLVNGSNLSKYDYALQGKSTIDNEYYYVNSLWNEDIKNLIGKSNKEVEVINEGPTQKEVEKENNDYALDGPILFNIELDNCFEKFLKDINDYQEIDNMYENGVKYEEGMALPKNPISNSISINEFYGAPDIEEESEKDILGIYTKNKIMEHLCNRSYKNTYFTDRECLFMLDKLNDLCKSLRDEMIIIKDDIMDDNKIIDGINKMFYEIIDAVRLHPDYDVEISFDKSNKCYNILDPENNGLTRSNFNNMFGTPNNTDVNASIVYGIVTLCKKDNNSGLLEILDSAYNGNVPRDVKNLIGIRSILDTLKKDIKENDKNNGKEFFKDLLRLMKDTGASESGIHNIKSLSNVYKYVLISITEGTDLCKEFIDSKQSYKSNSLKAGEYLITSINTGDASGNNVKCLNRSSNKITCHMYSSKGYEHNEELGKKTKLEENIESYNIDMWPRDKDVHILSMKYIKSQMSKASKKAIDELNDLRKEVTKIDTNYGEYFNEIKSIKYDSDSNEDYNNDPNFEKFKNNQISLIESIKKIKRDINKISIQNDFDKLVGSCDNIKGLKPLSEEGKNYSSSENYLRNNVFKNWDENFGFDTAFSLVYENVNFKDTFNKIENGLIPNEYYKKYTNDDLSSSLQIAKNNIGSYNKLISNEEK